MSEAKREVWVLENASGNPCKTTLTRRGVESPTNKTYGNSVVRYVPGSAQPAERAGEWVSVEERLPGEADPVLCRVEGDLPTVGFYRSYDKPLYWAVGWWSRNGHALAGVTHWMPLPPPPQPKGET